MKQFLRLLVCVLYFISFSAYANNPPGFVYQDRPDYPYRFEGRERIPPRWQEAGSYCCPSYLWEDKYYNESDYDYRYGEGG